MDVVEYPKALHRDGNVESGDFVIVQTADEQREQEKRGYVDGTRPAATKPKRKQA